MQTGAHLITSLTILACWSQVCGVCNVSQFEDEVKGWCITKTWLSHFGLRGPIGLLMFYSPCGWITSHFPLFKCQSFQPPYLQSIFSVRLVSVHVLYSCWSSNWDSSMRIIKVELTQTFLYLQAHSLKVVKLYIRAAKSKPDCHICVDYIITVHYSNTGSFWRTSLQFLIRSGLVIKLPHRKGALWQKRV